MTAMTQFNSLYLNGAFVEHTGATLEVLNPGNRQMIGRVADAGPVEVSRAVEAARVAQRAWGRRPAIERASFLKAVASSLRSNLQELVQTLVAEQGKVPGLAQLEVGLAAEYFDYMAEWARRIEGEIIESDRPDENIFLFRRPLGVVGAILPWNFPIFMIARKVAPALLTGNTVVVKPSEETPLSAMMVAGLIHEAGLPPGVFNLVNGGGATAGAALAGHPGVDMVSFTGSTRTGRKIYEAAARNITKVSLELGGKAPLIVLDDADIDRAVATVTASKTINTGQSCHCPERAYVQERVFSAFTEKLAGAMQAIRFGDASANPGVDMGPLINERAVQRLEDLVKDARERGANVVTGGQLAADEAGFHFQPTVVTHTSAAMEIMREEIFGPVMVVNPIRSLEEGIELANACQYGLTSSIFTGNLHSALKACRELRFGETYVNRENFEAIQGFHAGIRQSGIGGADGKHGLYEFMATQVVYM